MQVSRIQEIVSRFGELLQTRRAFETIYLWDLLQHAGKCWDVHAENWKDMYARTLDSPVTRRHWQRENWRPRDMMLTFLQEQPVTVRVMFEDLVDERKDLGNRIGRFRDNCDMLLRDHKKTHPKSIENNHYQDAEMIALYLAFQDPQRYTLYEGAAFRHFLQFTGSQQIPQTDDLPRYFNVMRILYTWLEKGGIFPLHARRMAQEGRDPGPHLLLAYECLQAFYSRKS